MKKLAFAAALLATSPALCDVRFDAGTNIEATTDPFFVPLYDPVLGETGARYGIIAFQIQSTGQVNNGFVTPFVVMFPQDDYSASVRIRLTESLYTGGYPDGPGVHCPLLTWAIYNDQGYADDGSLNSAQVETWLDEDCSLRPDPTLYNSGAAMGLEVSFQNATNNAINNNDPTARWLVAQQDNFVLMDGNSYIGLIFFSTGTLWSPPWVNFFIQQRGASGGTIVSPAFQDSSYNYMSVPDGFSVPLMNMLWQLGCETTDVTWVDTCFSGVLGTFYFYPSTREQEVIPYNSTLARFITPNGTSTDYNYDCTAPLGLPPIMCNMGNPSEYTVNRADLAAGLLMPQLFIVNGWTSNFDITGNPNYNFLGGQLYDAGDNFH